MGTNYYLHRNVCPHCGRGDDPLHIGKSSAGWCFSLHVIPESNIHDLDGWEREWLLGVIEDEYGEEISPGDMRQIIMARAARPFNEKQWLGYRDEADFHKQNYSERGPVGLLRHKIGRYCLKHGAGTWDCILGEFS